MAIRRFSGNEIENVSGGVGIVKGHANSYSPKRIVFRNAAELKAYADFLENYYGAGPLNDEEGEVFYIKETADEYKDDARSHDWKRRRNYFIDASDAQEMYDAFKAMYRNKPSKFAQYGSLNFES